MGVKMHITTPNVHKTLTSQQKIKCVLFKNFVFCFVLRADSITFAPAFEDGCAPIDEDGTTSEGCKYKPSIIKTLCT